MRLRQFHVHNYKGISNLTINWDDIVVLIGANNSGKSSAIEALSWFLGGSAIRDLSLFRRHEAGPDQAIELIGYFDQLTPRELEQPAVRGRTHNGEWILKKRYWLEEAGAGEQERDKWKEQLFSFSSSEVFQGWPDQDTSWAAFPAIYQAASEQIPNRPTRPNAPSREALRAIIRQQNADLVTESEPAWIPNPGGGGNWKSNANSVIPRAILVRAVHEASDETGAKDSSTYGKLINLIIERQLAQRQEMQDLRTALDHVLQLFRPDPQHPERQAEEIRTLQARINRNLSDVIAGEAVIKTEIPELRSLVMPSTSLSIRDSLAGIDTLVEHQGHGLQRTLIIALLQLLTEAQDLQAPEGGLVPAHRSVILMVEEPELYMHPQMERRMRDVLYRLAEQPSFQVICCTHSPVFVDVADKHSAIVRITRQQDGDVAVHQVTGDLFPGPAGVAERQRLQAVARFNPTVNELFFADQVVLLEEFSALVAFERAGELMGLFQRHPRVRRGVCLVDCAGKGNIPGFQRVLNSFHIQYRVVHDQDTGNAAAEAENVRINAEITGNPNALAFPVQPTDLESLLGYQAPSKQKPLCAYRRVETLVAQGALPAAFIEALNMVYFGAPQEPPTAGMTQEGEQHA